MIYILIWLVIGALGYIAGLISDYKLYERKMKIDVGIVILSLSLGPFIWAFLLNSIIEYIRWKRKKNDKRQKQRHQF